MCLQEVGVDYEPFLTAEMGHKGYVGVFYPKEMGTMEGLATYWKKDKFELEEVQDPLRILPSVILSCDMIFRILELCRNSTLIWFSTISSPIWLQECKIS